MIRRLAKSIRQYRAASIWAPIFILGECVMEVLIPTLMANLIDYGVEMGSLRYVLLVAGKLLLCALISLTCGFLSADFAAKASTGFGANLRHDIFYRVQDFSFSNIDQFSSSSLVTRLTTDVTNVQNAYMMIIRAAFRAPALIIFSIIMAARINASMSIIFLVAVPVLAIGIYFLMSRTHPIMEWVFRTYDKLNNVVAENLHGIRVVKSFVREDFEKKKFGDISDEIYRGFVKGEKRIILNMPLMMVVVYICMLLVSWLGAKAILLSGNNPALGMTTGQLTGMFTYTLQIMMSLMMLSMVFMMIIISRASAERIDEVLRTEPSLHSPENALTSVSDGSIQFENVSFRYSKKAERSALEDVTLHIRSGETIGILGGTGSSKSTLVQLIPRLYDVTEGRILVGGRDVREYDLGTLRNAVAMVLQKNVLFSGTIKDNLRWGNEHATEEEMRHACRLAQADSFIDAFPNGYDTHIEQGGSNVSGGQKQRLCIARALLKKPKILILDDSTSAVDTHTDALIRNAFREELPDTTKLIIAQRVSSVEDADRVIVLDSGRICGFDTPENLMHSNEIYREVAASQKKGEN
ncbi:MAG: ABC transporter ATP-binding protein [Oscillospiraceae bacterium]|nr:ABC transporter ATP-binding protein [Oscillospiraceae bacterium]